MSDRYESHQLLALEAHPGEYWVHSQVCKECGVVVMDTAKHDTYHLEVARAIYTSGMFGPIGGNPFGRFPG